MMVNSTSLIPKTMTATPSYGETLEKKEFSRCLESAINEKNNKKLHAACQELESVFINKVLDSMLQSIPRGEFTGHSFATETFESMLYTEYARSMSKTGSLGIAEVIYKQLSGQM